MTSFKNYLLFKNLSFGFQDLFSMDGTAVFSPSQCMAQCGGQHKCKARYPDDKSFSTHKISYSFLYWFCVFCGFVHNYGY